MCSLPSLNAYGIAPMRSSTCSGSSRAASTSTPASREVDERQLVPGGEHLRDALARSDALLDECGGERSRLLRAAAGEGELVLGDELRRREQVDHELDRLVHAVRRGQGLAGLPDLGHAGAKRRKGGSRSAHGLVKVADVTNPSNELSASGEPEP